MRWMKTKLCGTVGYIGLQYHYVSFSFIYSMNYRNRTFVMAVRILFGLFFIMSGVGGLMTGQSLKGVPEPMIPTMQILWHTGILQYIKITEAAAGLMLVTGFLPWLAAIFLAPICIGVIIVNARISPEYIIMGVGISLVNAYLGYAYWDKYKALFERT